MTSGSRLGQRASLAAVDQDRASLAAVADQGDFSSVGIQLCILFAYKDSEGIGPH